MAVEGGCTGDGGSVRERGLRGTVTSVVQGVDTLGCTCYCLDMEFTVYTATEDIVVPSMDEARAVARAYPGSSIERTK